MIRLAELIKQNGLTQKEFAKRLNLAPTTVNNYAKGLREPDYETLGVFCDFFGCTADYLLGRSSSPSPAITDEDAAHLLAYHAAPPEIRASVDTILAAYVPQAAKEKDA